jgi:hypothetical protein
MRGREYTRGRQIRTNKMGTAFVQAQNSLAPYIRSRKEASQIRQVLTAHLLSEVNPAAGHAQGPVISLVHDSTSVKIASGSIPGLQKEYLKALRANIKACREYDRVCNTNSLRNGDLTSRDVLPGSSYSGTNLPCKSDHLDSYLALIKKRQRHERLRILQDYADKLEHKSAAATFFPDQTNPQLSGLPQLPVEIVASSASGVQEQDHKALKDLIRGLEQAVLRAKVQLRNEKQLLEQVRAGSSKRRRGDLNSVPRDVQTLQALGRTRNELITWVEEELGKAGDSGSQDIHEAHHRSPPDTKESIEDQLTLVKAQYGRYVQARQIFIDTIAEMVEPVLTINPSEKKESEAEDNEMETTPLTTWIVSPYLRDLQLISNEQKSSIQQKSHLTVSLAKQHKETAQLFDRLAHESHLLPQYPQPTSKASRRDHSQFDLDAMAGKEMPSAAHRARAWTYAAESASAATKDFVLASMLEGEAAIEGAREMLSTLEKLLGRKKSSTEPGLVEDDIWTSDTTSSKRRANKSIQQAKNTSAQGNIWAVLDGNIGVLHREEDKRLS